MDKDLRRLVLVGAALAVVLFVGRVVVGAFYDVGDLRRRVDGLRRTLTGEAASQPDPTAARAAEAHGRALGARLQELIPLLHYERPPEFDVPAGASPDLAYLEILRREQEALVQGSRYLGKSVPLDLGMPIPNPTGMEDVLNALRAMHVVHRVVSAAIAANVDAIDSIAISPVSRQQRAQGGFLKTHRVEFELHGSPRAVRDTLAAAAGGSPYLALDDVRLEAQDEDGEALRCRMVAALLSIDPEQSVADLPRGTR